jgi:hypothetical protein
MAGKFIFYRNKEQNDTFFTLWVSIPGNKSGCNCKTAIIKPFL